MDEIASLSATEMRRRVAYCPDLVGIGIEPDVEYVCRRAAFELTQAGAPVEEVGLDLALGREAFLALRGLWMVVWIAPACHWGFKLQGGRLAKGRS